MRYRATICARRQGAIGIWQNISVVFRADEAYELPADLRFAAIIAANQMGWECHHVVSVDEEAIGP